MAEKLADANRGAVEKNAASVDAKALVAAWATLLLTVLDGAVLVLVLVCSLRGCARGERNKLGNPNPNGDLRPENECRNEAANGVPTNFNGCGRFSRLNLGDNR